MQAEYEVIDGVMVIHLRGHLSYEWAGVFRSNCLKQLAQLQYEKVVFNLSQLSFVGSSGISEFLETITELSSNRTPQIKFSGVANEFQRIFQASPLKDIEIYEDDKTACSSFYLVPQVADSLPRETLSDSPHLPQEFKENPSVILEGDKKNKL